MTKTVWKYTVPITPGPHTIEMGKNKKILHVGSTDVMRSIHFWAEHDGITEERTFQIFGTGDTSIPDTAEYVGTVIHPGAAIVLHLYDVTKEGTK